MRENPWPMAAMILLALLVAGPALAADPVTLTGEYVWEDGDNEGVLEQVVFTPTGSGAWDVVFHFRFRGRKHVYTGTAQGSLSDGSLSGKVQDEDKERNFTFSGEFKSGSFTGVHNEVDGSRSWRTGTLTLGR